MVKNLEKATRKAIKRYGVEGVFILAASVRNLKGDGPLAQLIRNGLVDIPIYVGSTEDIIKDGALLRNKLAILSFNAAKGCERPCAILAGFDDSHFIYYAREWADSTRLPNVLTVAATRATHQLIVVAGKHTLRTVNSAILHLHSRVHGYVRPPIVCCPRPYKQRTIQITDLIRRLHPATARTALEYLCSCEEKDDGVARSDQPLQDRIQAGPLTEHVGDIYETVAKVLAAVSCTGSSNFGAEISMPVVVKTDKSHVWDVLSESHHASTITVRNYNSVPAIFWEMLSAALSAKPQARTAAEWAVLTVAHEAFYNGRWHLARQLRDYSSWIDAPALERLSAVVQEIIGNDAAHGQFAVPLTLGPLATENGISGCADYVSPAGVVWEFTLGPLREEHELQLGCYLALRGGGEGILSSLTLPESRRLKLDASNAQAYLKTLLASPPPQQQSCCAADLIFKLDADKKQQEEERHNDTQNLPSFGPDLDSDQDVGVCVGEEFGS
ncbi:helicase [Elysia marginata]|uniref:Helicase n=1 Tax=Elysia marginata TaxID=1093978 RepID=A0AAV4GRG7_9GAST|nr:helicase [Elysia marginata]